MPRNPGLLTTKDREKLTGEQSLDDYTNVDQWKGRVRESIRKTYRDMALLEESPYWKDDDFAKVFKDSLRNTDFYSRLSDDGVENGFFGTKAQTKIYGSTIQDFAQNLEEMDIDGSWKDEDNTVRAVQEMFVQNIVHVMVDVLELVGVTDDSMVEEFFEDIWPEKEQALEIVREELTDS